MPWNALDQHDAPALQQEGIGRQAIDHALNQFEMLGLGFHLNVAPPLRSCTIKMYLEPNERIPNLGNPTKLFGRIADALVFQIQEMG